VLEGWCLEEEKIENKKQKTKKQIRVDRGSWRCDGACGVGAGPARMLGPA
jgi:hypothetical protein